MRIHSTAQAFNDIESRMEIKTRRRIGRLVTLNREDGTLRCDRIADTRVFPFKPDIRLAFLGLLPGSDP